MLICSIATPSLPAYIVNFLFYRQSDFLPLTPMQSPPNFTRCLATRISEISSLLASCSPMTSATNVADAVDAFESCCLHIERAKREFLQPPPCPDGLMLRACVFLHPLPLSPFASKYTPSFAPFQASTQVPALFFRRAGCGIPTTA